MLRRHVFTRLGASQTEKCGGRGDSSNFDPSRVVAQNSSVFLGAWVGTGSWKIKKIYKHEDSREPNEINNKRAEPVNEKKKNKRKTTQPHARSRTTADPSAAFEKEDPRSMFPLVQMFYRTRLLRFPPQLDGCLLRQRICGTKHKYGKGRSSNQKEISWNSSPFVLN